MREFEPISGAEEMGAFPVVERQVNPELPKWVYGWVIAHQAVGETVCSLTPRQLSIIQRRDLTGIVKLPNFIERKK